MAEFFRSQDHVIKFIHIHSVSQSIVRDIYLAQINVAASEHTQSWINLTVFPSE
jgi:hypothetical protein